MSFVTRLARCLALVAGFVVLSGAAHAACSSPPSAAGGFNYNSIQQRFEYCDTSDTWKPLGASVIASLTDVSITNLAGRDYLRYDAGTSKWVNISESTVMSTTTMISNWPDAIRCNYSASDDMIFYYYYGASGPTAIYMSVYGGANALIRFNTSDKSYLSNTGLYNGGTYNCVARSISQLYASGQAFNFIGNANTSGGALGDRITSGTVSVTTNPNGYISLTTGVTDWGYFSSGISYLPTITANRVSSTNVSATYIQFNSPSTVLACNSGVTGAMRYTSGTMQVCDGSNWGNIGIGVPTGTIAAFAASSCPNGWSEYTASRGRFLRGIDNGAGIDPSGTRAAGHLQDDAIQNLTGNLDGLPATGNIDGVFELGAAYGTFQTGSSSRYRTTFNASRVARTSTETRPKNVAVTFCVYSGYQSVPGQTILTTLASLTDVSVAGATTGQVLSFNGASWVASNTSAGTASVASSTGAVQFNGTGTAMGGDTANFYWDNSNKRLGIGTDVPATTLEVNGSFLVSASTTPAPAPSLYINSSGLVGIGSTPSSNAGLYLSSVTTAGVTVYGMKTNLSVEPATAPTSGQAYRGQYTYAGYNSAQTSPNGSLRGAEFYTYKTGSGSISTTYGLMSYASGRGGGGNVATVNALYAMASVSESVFATNVYGSLNYAYDYTGAGSGGGITNAYSIYATGHSSVGNVTNYYGVYVSAFGGVDPSGNFYGLYVSDPAMKNYFAGNTGIGVTSPMAKLDVAGTISASDAIQVGTSSLACTSGIRGSMRYSQVSSTMEYCNSNAWVSTGPSDTAPISFHVNNSGNFAITTGNTTATWDTEVFDTGGGFSSDTFTAPVAGRYHLVFNASCTVSCRPLIQITSGGSVNYGPATAASAEQVVSIIVNLNAGDTAKAAVIGSSAGSLRGGVQYSNFQGSILGPQSGGGGGSTPAGSTGDIQFNNGGALAADTNQLFWDAANNRLGVGKNNPSYPVDVNGVVQATSFFQSSDRTLKDNIVQIRSGLSVIDNLRPVTFDWKKDGRHAAGLIAQDVLNVIPTAVTSNTAGVYSVDYTQTIPYLIRAMQELKADNDTGLRRLKADNDTLKNENQKLARENKAILKRLDELERRTGTRGH